MKKSIKIATLLVILALALVLLAGCGKNKLVATKTTEEGGIKLEEKMEITFGKDDKIETVVETMTFEDEETAKSMADIFGGSDEVEGFEVKQDGKSMIMTMDAKTFTELEGEEDNMSKEDIKKELEEEGYTVK